MDKFKCLICGHIYNPEKGEPLQNIKPGIDFLSLPPDWVCPVCTAEKSLFAKE